LSIYIFQIIHIQFVHFFCSSKRNEPKKKTPEMTTLAQSCACYTSHIGATDRAEVRAISGLLARFS
jgi:hypothetical protein